MERGLVSIITPCYNSATLVPRLLESVLRQDYPRIEMIVVDDGSNDNSKAVLDGYRLAFESRGIPYTLLTQENGGQSSAINNALKWVRGEYLLWPDSDDFYNRDDAVSLLVDTFQGLPKEYGMIKTLPKYVDEASLNEITGNRFIDRREWQFEQALFDQDFIWGFYMIRTSALDTVNPLREIYVEKKAGQNWQMVLPLLYSFKCYTLDENVFSVLIRSNSHSRLASSDIVPYIELNDTYERTILHTLDRINEMPDEERESYKKRIRAKYARQRLLLSCSFRDKRRARKYKKELLQTGSSLSMKDSLRYFLMHLNLYPLPGRR